MAKKRSKKDQTPQKAVENPAPEQGISRIEPGFASNPFAAMRRLSDEMEQLFHGVGLGDFRVPRLWRGFDVPQAWGPDIDMFERKGELVVRADLPGLNKEDVKVEITDSELTIEGERKSEKEEKREGYYRSERSYGSFRRVVALPEGIKADRAKATCKDGVLEITIPTAGARKKGGRRLPIKT